MKRQIKKLTGFMMSAVTAGIADMGIFTLLTQVVFPQSTPLYTTVATIVARVASSFINFAINCRLVFHGKAKQAAGRYYVLWTGQLICSCISVNILGHGFDLPLTVAKVLVDISLGLFSYLLQCNWVYREEDGFYGSFARLARWLFRTFSHRYQCRTVQRSEPVVYVCRHLNMHGPYTTLKWLPFHVHPMILHVFFDRKTTVQHMTQYTLSTRYGKKPRRFSFAAHAMGWIAPPMMRSLQAVPVYRNGTQSIATVKQGLKYLLKNESLIVYPDIQYTDGYEKPSEIYDGFLYLGDLYFKKTGKGLSFVPLLIDDENRRIIEGTPVCVTRFRAEGATAAEYLKKAINKEKIT